MNDLEILEKILRRNRNLRLVIGILLATISLFVLFSTPVDRFQTAVALLFALGGVALAVLSIIHYDVRKSTIFETLSRDPDKIVWVYYYRVQMMPFGVSIGQMCSLFFRLDDREKIDLRAPESEILELMNTLRNRLPHATFGHNQEKEQLYRANPDLLRK